MDHVIGIANIPGLGVYPSGSVPHNPFPTSGTWSWIHIPLTYFFFLKVQLPPGNQQFLSSHIILRVTCTGAQEEWVSRTRAYGLNLEPSRSPYPYPCLSRAIAQPLCPGSRINVCMYPTFTQLVYPTYPYGISLPMTCRCTQFLSYIMFWLKIMYFWYPLQKHYHFKKVRLIDIVP